MVFTNKYTQILMGKTQGFARSKSLKEIVDLYCGEEDTVNISVIFTALTEYVVEELIIGNSEATEEELGIYKLIEEMREKFCDYPEGTEESDFDTALCTCFSENLINRARSNKIRYERFAPFLGTKSKEYCKSWDKFTDVRSLGLWTDQEWATR